MPTSQQNERWKSEPEKKDFRAARTYLSLLVARNDAQRYAKMLAVEKRLWHFKASDLLRASNLALLPETDLEVEKDLAKVRAHLKLSPVLLVRGEPLWVADGYHRICASYHIDEDALVACKIIPRLPCLEG